MKFLGLSTASLVATALILSGCGDNNDADPTATLPVQVTAISAASATPGAERSPTAATSTIAAATPTTASVRPCTVDDLELSTSPTGAAAGTHFVALIVTNIGDEPCTILGFPGVSLLDAAGGQVGPAAERNIAFQPASVLLAPGEKANATTGFPNWQNFDQGVCPTESTSVRLYPPDNLDSLIVPFGDHACPGFSVKPFEAGIGDAQES